MGFRSWQLKLSLGLFPPSQPSIPSPPWYGYFIDSGPDRSNGENPRYGISSPIKHVILYEGNHVFIQSGDVIRLCWVNRYQHGATMLVTKVNPKTFKAIEIKGSYRPGTNWTVSKTAGGLHLDIGHTSDERIAELHESWT